jgi:hypothetical protein
MAQTRAISRALRAPLSQIVKMAGYDPTGAEEMPSQVAPTAAPAVPSRATLLQRQQMRSLFEQLKHAAPVVDWASQCSELAGKPSDELSEAEAERVIEQMRAWVVELEGGADEDA